MAARLTALLPRLLALTVILLLGAATFTLAAEKKPGVAEQTASTPEAKPEVLVVPDVRGKAYVFAKGILQDAGFAWRVQGAVQGYSANAVIYQTLRAPASSTTAPRRLSCALRGTLPTASAACPRTTPRTWARASST
jgi:hypothetical protein